MDCERQNRRVILAAAGSLGASMLLAACTSKDAGDVSPVEDLMREHGVLRRVVLLYDEVGRRLEHQETFPLDALTSAAGIVRRFIEDYHEKLEEDFVFPCFERANKLVELVTVLRRQHQAGRRLTDDVQQLSTPATMQSPDGRSKLVAALRAFRQMYEPHAAREDTVLFPELRSLVGAKKYDALGDTFEDKEHALFGARGFEGVVAEVAQLENALGIHDLGSFTPS